MFTPGIVMCPPMRYTTSSPSVNRMRLRSSATANRFLTLSTAMGRFLYGLGRAAGGGNFLGRLATELMNPDGQALVDVAARQYLDALRRVRHEPLFAQQLQRDDGPFVEALGERVEIHHGVLNAERVVEPALGHSPVERPLAAFESTLALIA